MYSVFDVDWLASIHEDHGYFEDCIAVHWPLWKDLFEASSTWGVNSFVQGYRPHGRDVS